jgi:hypothetical protein
MKKPKIVVEKYQRGNDKWEETKCSECLEDVHKTSRFCVHCGAWFGTPKGTK